MYKKFFAEMIVFLAIVAILGCGQTPNPILVDIDIPPQIIEKKVEVPVEVVKEVIKEVEVEKIVEVPVEVVKEVEVEKPVEVPVVEKPYVQNKILHIDKDFQGYIFIYTNSTVWQNLGSVSYNGGFDGYIKIMEAEIQLVAYDNPTDIPLAVLPKTDHSVNDFSPHTILFGTKIAFPYMILTSDLERDDYDYRQFERCEIRIISFDQ